MKIADQILAEQFESGILSFGRVTAGLKRPTARKTFARQLVDSAHRTKYVTLMRSRTLSPLRVDPSSELFDPILAAIRLLSQGEIDEASWLIFLSVHFGKHGRTGWALCRRVYGTLCEGAPWTWSRIVTDAEAFKKWLGGREGKIKAGPPVASFGNHRKFETLRDLGDRGTPAAIATYVNWIKQSGDHKQKFDSALKQANGDGKLAFDILYKSMNVASFGRLAKFDYLSMLGKVGVTAIQAGSTYVEGATGPLKGAGILFFADKKVSVSTATLDQWLVELANHLGVTMQDMEDAVCNWQKSPTQYQSFRG